MGARARAERTENIWRMVVTLDASKVSGWLNALAPCRAERGACTTCAGEVRAGRREGLRQWRGAQRAGPV